MTQLSFGELSTGGPLPLTVERVDDELILPEGLATTIATHGLHRFPGKFVPQIPRFVLQRILPEDGARVYDPFCGSGTTLVECALARRPFYGTDIDPLAVFVSRVKTTSLDAGATANLEHFWSDFSSAHVTPVEPPAIPRLSHWFREETIRQLAVIKAYCLKLDPHLRDFSLVVFSSIIRRVSNADDQTQKTYVSGTLPKTPPQPFDLFPRVLARALRGVREFHDLAGPNILGTVELADVRQRPPERDIVHVVTSPPYLDSIDYVYNQMLEHYWLLDVLGTESYEGVRRQRRMSLGSPNGSKEAEKTHSDPEVDRLGEIVAQHSEKEAAVVRRFFSDYTKHAEFMYAIQPRGSYYVTVVAPSTVRGSLIDTPSLIAAIHARTGYTLIDRMTYRIRRHYMKFPRRSNSGTITRDQMFVFRRT